jgi:2-methylcitrate dehydratase PrpD
VTPSTSIDEPGGASSRLLADFLAGTSFGDLPAQVVADARLAVLDWFGSALAGALEPPARIAREVVAGFGASEEATIFPAGRSSAAGAALANGVASHILELDDVHKGSTLHGAAPIVPAALAVAERERADGRAFLLAVVLGYEAALRVGEAVNPSHYRFWHPTGTAATFGAAAAAGSLLRLDARQMLDALGSAGTQAAGLWEFNADGAMSKHLHPGKAAFNGVLAADLARRGFTGATRILEGERGFFRATSAGHDATRIGDGLGRRWKISENCYKLHSCCGHTHTAIDVALDLRSGLGWSGAEAVEAVDEVRIATYGPGYEIVREPNPRTPYQAKFSLAYCVAAALLEGRVGLAQFAPERFGPAGVAEPRIASLLDRTRVEVDPAMTAQYPERWPCRLTLTLADGRDVAGESDYPRGNPESPVPFDVLQAKAVDLIASRYDAALAERVIGSVGRLEGVEDMAAMMRQSVGPLVAR